MRRQLTGGLVLTAVVLVVAVAMGQTTQPGTQPQPQAEQPVPTVQGSQLLPLSERTRTFRIIAGDGEGEQVQQTLSRVAPGGFGQWELTLGDMNRLYLRRDAEGDVEVVRMDLIGENRAVVYEPAVRLIPGRIEPQIAVETAGRARIYNLETGEFIRRGEVEHRIEQVTRARFDTAVGDREGYLVVIEHVVDLDLGEARIDLEAGYVPEQGMVYRHMRYTLEKLGLFGSTTRRTAVLAEELDAQREEGN